MDPQTAAFTPQNDTWRLSEAMRSFQQTQQEHSDRLGRLERRQDSDARVKSVWGAASPFPGVLSGTPQNGPQQHPNVDFSGFDDDDSATNMVRSLNMDADDEPRRLNFTSRANSVRFDESAKQSQWNHGNRSSIDLFSRASSGLGGPGGLGGHPLFDRSTSHKSDGRQSSAGQSASGRANSLGLEFNQDVGQATDLPGFSPGLAILGTVPSIIRCFLNQDRTHDTMLYAAVCTGSYRSYLDIRMIEQLHLGESVRQDISGNNKIKLPVYLAEAVSFSPLPRADGDTPRLHSISVDFHVVDCRKTESSRKAIQIFLGSDALRQHNADVLFSSNTLALYDDDRNKLSMPLARPESDETFKALSTGSISIPTSKQPLSFAAASSASQDSLKSLANGTTASINSGSSVNNVPSAHKDSVSSMPARKTEDEQPAQSPIATPEDTPARPKPSQGHDRKPSLEPLKTPKADKDMADQAQGSSGTRTSSSPAIWSNWRRDTNASSAGGADGTSTPLRNTSTSYQRPSRDMGIKVLKPSASRQSTLKSSNASPSQSPSTPQSRFFEDGRRRTATEDSGQMMRSGSDDRAKSAFKDGSTALPASATKTRSANPIGGASAFGWLNVSGQK